MSLDVSDALSEAVERITTQAGAVLIGLYTIASVLQIAATQDIVRELLEALRDWGQDELSTDEYQELVDATDPVLDELPLSLGLDLLPAILLWFVALFLGVAIVAVAIDAFARSADGVDEIAVSHVPWHVLNLVVGGIAFAVLVVIGLIVFLVPGLLLAFLLVFFPIAVVVDDANFVSAFVTSVETVTDNLLASFLLVLLAIVVGIGMGVLNAAATVALSDAAAGVVSAGLSAASTLFVLALLTRAYVGAHEDEAAETTSESGTTAG